MPQANQTDRPLDVAALLQAYDAQGVHRTGHPGDDASADWLIGIATSLGAQPTAESFAFNRLDPGDCYVEVGNRRIPGTPVFDSPVTGPDGVAGTLGGDIGLDTLSPLSIYQSDYHAYRTMPGRTALVSVTQGGRPGLALLNAERFGRPWGLPNLQVSSEFGPVLQAARGAPARVVCEVRHVPSRLRNVVVSIPGHDPTAAPVVVMTPRSGWWHCASERGGGIVAWIAVLAALRDRPSVAPVTMVASSGHELGHIGLDDFMARRRGWETTATWLHFGANLGANGGVLALQSPQEDLRRLGVAALQAAGAPAATLSPPTTVPNGESRDIHRAGGRYLTLVGTNPWFHLPHDRYPESVDVPAIERIAVAGAQIAMSLADA